VQYSTLKEEEEMGPKGEEEGEEEEKQNKLVGAPRRLSLI